MCVCLEYSVASVLRALPSVEFSPGHWLDEKQGAERGSMSEHGARVFECFHESVCLQIKSESRFLKVKFIVDEPFLADRQQRNRQ